LAGSHDGYWLYPQNKENPMTDMNTTEEEVMANWLSPSYHRVMRKHEGIKSVFLAEAQRRESIMGQIQVGMYITAHYTKDVMFDDPIWEVVKVHKKTIVVKTGTGTRRVYPGHIFSVMSAEEGRKQLTARMARIGAKIEHYETLSANSVGEEKREAKRTAAFYRRLRKKWLRIEVHDQSA
jgi:hypothetical protein